MPDTTSAGGAFDQISGRLSGVRAGTAPDVREPGAMTATDPDRHFGEALSDFCGQLHRLRKESGVSVSELVKDRTILLGRTQIYAILGGYIESPPAWDFVHPFVLYCVQRGSRKPSVSTDLAYWRHEHALVVDLYNRPRPGVRTGAEAPDPTPRTDQVLTVQHSDVRLLPPSRDGERRSIGVVTGDLRQVRGADIWVNSENTDMVMARIQERSISAIIRYEGASRDAAGRVVVDHIADELEAKVTGVRPIGPGSVVVTGAGDLSRYGVRHVIHAAAVHGAPGAGFQPIKEIGRCVANALEAAEKLTPDGAPATVLFPLLGCGDAGGAVAEIAPALIHTAINHLRVAAGRVGCVLFLAWTQDELVACRNALNAATDVRIPAQRATSAAAVD